MRNPTAPWALAAALVFGAPPAMTQSARAQEPRGGGESDAERLDRLERRMTEMETRHAEEIKARDEEIAQLRSQVGQQDDEARAGEPDDIEQTRADVLRDLESREPVPLTVRTPADINPRMAVISDFLAWTGWSPWERMDPAMKRPYGGAPSGVGAEYAWDGD